MIETFKNNILVTPITKQSGKRLSVDNESFSRKVDSRLNCGLVVSVSKNVSGVKVGDVVGYSTLDGVNILHDNTDYILLSERETQAVILCDDIERVRFKEHNREDANDYVWRNELVKNDIVQIS
jgi:hypothetical protein